MKEFLILFLIIVAIPSIMFIPIYMKDKELHETRGDIKIQGTWYPKELIDMIKERK